MTDDTNQDPNVKVTETSLLKSGPLSRQPVKSGPIDLKKVIEQSPPSSQDE